MPFVTATQRASETVLTGVPSSSNTKARGVEHTAFEGRNVQIGYQKLASTPGVGEIRTMFRRYVLRALDVDEARAFYREVAGLDFSAAPEKSGIEVWPLHEQARARGAPPHWLGQLAVVDVEAAVGRLLELGAERLGPTVRGRDGAAFATLRDPLGAVVGVRESMPPPERTPVAWHHLNTRDLERAWTVYAELFGWHHTETMEAADLEGGLRMFAWDRSGETVGSIANTARLPGVHTHWLFYFPVADLEASLALVRAKGGKTLAPVVLPNGNRLAPCDDPQGAAFGLFSSAQS
ncbi:MAG: VOC family protein [Myxococcales bacterium]|mgnify:CR=1 FL=1|nr:VOC family protein [Myxococcales bacterium]